MKALLGPQICRRSPPDLLLGFPRHNCRVPHISLVFREMWDTASLPLKRLAGPTTRTWGRKRWAKPTRPALRLSPPQLPGAPHLAGFSRDVGYRRTPPQARCGSQDPVRVPHVRPSVGGPKTMGEAPPQPLLISIGEAERRDPPWKCFTASQPPGNQPALAPPGSVFRAA
jgi:hypothetical protein